MKKQRGFSELAIVALLFIAFSAVVFGIQFAAGFYTCHQRANMMKLESRYGLLTGCMVRVDDRWAPLSYIRIVDGKIQIYGDGE